MSNKLLCSTAKNRERGFDEPPPYTDQDFNHSVSLTPQEERNLQTLGRKKRAEKEARIQKIKDDIYNLLHNCTREGQLGLFPNSKQLPKLNPFKTDEDIPKKESETNNKPNQLTLNL